MKKNSFSLLIIFAFALILPLNAYEEKMPINRNISYKPYGYGDHYIGVENVITITDQFYNFTVPVMNISREYDFKVYLTVQVNGTGNPNDFTYKVDNPLFTDFIGNIITQYPENWNSKDATLNRVSATFTIPRSATSVTFSGWVQKNNEEKNKFNETIDFSRYDEVLKARLGKIEFDSQRAELQITSPTYSGKYLRTLKHIVTVEGSATDNEGIAFVKINGSKVILDSQNKFNKICKLNFGLNTIRVETEDIHGNQTKKELLVYRDEIIEEEVEISDVDLPPNFNNLNNNGIAVVIGIEEYENAPDVEYAKNDADIFREYLITTFGFKRENIYFKLNKKATKSEFDKIFSTRGWLYRNTNINSDVFIFYSGHGVPDVDEKQSYLLPANADPNYAMSTGYSLNELYENFDQLKAKSITVIIDACFSGATRDDQMLIANSRPIIISIDQGLVPSNTVVFTASSGSEISSGYNKKEHGLFTYYFLKGLNKNADINTDGEITVNEMFEYLKVNIPTQARKMGREQNPKLFGTEKKRILLKY